MWSRSGQVFPSRQSEKNDTQPTTLGGRRGVALAIPFGVVVGVCKWLLFCFACVKMSYIDRYTDITNSWMESLLSTVEHPGNPRAGINDWPLASGSACFTVLLSYLIGTVVRKEGGLYRWCLVLNFP